MGVDVKSYHRFGELKLFRTKVGQDFDAAIQKRFSLMRNQQFVAILQVQPIEESKLLAGETHIVLAGLISQEILEVGVNYDVAGTNQQVIGTFSLCAEDP